MGLPDGEYDFVVRGAERIEGKFGPQIQLQLEAFTEGEKSSFATKAWLDDGEVKNEKRKALRNGFCESIGVRGFDFTKDQISNLVGKYGRAKMAHRVDKITGEVSRWLSVESFMEPLPPKGLEDDLPF